MASQRSSMVVPRLAAISPKWRARKRSLAARCNRQLLIENLERRLLLAADWQNAINRLDVSDDGVVTPLDALVVINELNRRRISDDRGRLPPRPGDSPRGTLVDTNGDGFASPIDALLVINALNGDRQPPLITVGLVADTAPQGTFNNDGVTFRATLAGQVRDELTGVVSLQAQIDLGPLVSVSYDPRLGTFTFDPSLAPGGIADGQHTIHFRARDALGNSSPLTDVTFALDTRAPIAPALALSLTSALGEPQDGTTQAGRVTLVGHTDPSINVVLLGVNRSALSSSSGNFQFPGVTLDLGDNLVVVEAQDVAGNVSAFQATLHRVDSPGTPDPVLLWNRAALDAIRLDATTPPVATRNLAIMHAAVYDVVSNLEGTPSYYVGLQPPVDASPIAAVSAAAHRVLSYLYPGQVTTLDAALAAALTGVPDGLAKTDGLQFGNTIGEAIIALRAGDGWDTFVDDVPGSGPGVWQPTAPMYDQPLLPQWRDVEPFAMSRSDQFRPAGPAALDGLEYAAAFNEVKALGSASGSNRTAEQTQIARFWADGAGTHTPPGHWNQIAEQVAVAQGNSLSENARLFVQLDLALADAAIAGWDAKYQDNFWRPLTAIQQADTDGNPDTAPDTGWTSLLITPPFPEYVSGHATFSAAAATVLAAHFGNNLSFDTTSIGLPGVSRSFASFEAAAAEAGQSRIYGGIHFQFSNVDGQATGQAVADYVLGTFSVSSDTRAPTILLQSPASGTVVAGNITIAGRVLDNRSGVIRLSVQLDDGAFAELPFDTAGNFTLTTTLTLDGSADAAHVLRLRGTDAAGNVSPLKTFYFTLDTRAPALIIDTPVNAGSVDATTLLSGFADGTGSPITRLTYQLDAGTVTPIAFDPATGRFDQSLDLSRLATGSHTLSVTARDAAGHEATENRSVNLPTAIAFGIRSFTPRDGANDVGTTFRPQVFFSRPVDPSSLTENNFFAIGPSGTKLPARIVTAQDGSFAWLFLTDPMPGAARITVHVEGATIRAAADGALLDADGNGQAGDTFDFSFTTVSLTPLLGTSLSGKVVDPGSDLKPMTLDDTRAGIDGVLHTADDLFLLPIAGVKVFILGMEDQAVFTDTLGNFHFDAVPAGNVKLAVDGRTATNAPANFYFPEMVMDVNLDAGRANTAMGAMGTLAERAANRDRQEVYLPRLRTSILHDVSNTQSTRIGVDAESAPNLTPQQRALLTIDVQPGSLLDQNGNSLTTGRIGISTVPPELVREMLPSGLLQHAFDITIQAPGITNLSAPAPMTFPNTFGAAPGSQLNFLGFDHTTGRLVIEGTATVSADGLSVSTDPGTGITRPGWYAMTPPGGPGGPDPGLCQSPSAPLLDPDGEPGAGTFTFGRFIGIPGQEFSPVEDFGFATNQQKGQLVFHNLQPRAACFPQHNELLVNVTVNNGITNQFLKGLTKKTFFVQPNKIHTIEFFPKLFELSAKDPKFDLGKLDSDRLYGAKVTVQIRARQGATYALLPDQPQPFYVYRYVDAGDDVDDAQLDFLPTLADGPDGSRSSRTVEIIGDAEVLANDVFHFGDITHFRGVRISPSLGQIVFDPKSIGGKLETSLDIITPEPDSRSVGDLLLTGEGRDKYRVFVNTSGLDKLLTEMSVFSTPQDIGLELHPPGSKLPGTFRFTVKDRPPTRAFVLDATRITKTELEAAFAGLLGAGNFSIDVRTDTTSTPNRVDITVVFRNALADGPRPYIEVEASGANLVSAWSEPRARFGRITPSEVALFDTPEKRAALIQEVVRGIQIKFSPFSKGIEFTDDPRKAFLEIEWATHSGLLELGGVVSESVQQQTAALIQFAADSDKYNRKSLAYRLVKILARPKSASAFVNVDDILEAGSFVPYALNRDQFVSALIGVAVHEAGHVFGLQHTSASVPFEIDDEVQRLEVASRGNPGDTFTLSFAGEKGVRTLMANSTSGDVLAALLELVTVAADVNHVSVDGPTGGPWTVHFVRPGTPRNQHPAARFLGTDVPPIEADSKGDMLIAQSTVKEGRSELRTPRGTDRRLGSFHGWQDLMAGGSWLDLTGNMTFLPRFSQTALLIGTYDSETTVLTDARDYVDLIRFSRIIPGGQLGLGLDPESDALPNNFLYLDLGPRLVVFQNGVSIGPEPLDFGKVIADKSGGQMGVQQLRVLNLGSQNVLVRSIRVTQGFDQFSVPPISTTTLRPGESLDVDVTFDPQFSGPAAGVLSIESDVVGFSGRFDLQGIGQPPAPAPGIHVDFGLNDFDGVLVGETRSLGDINVRRLIGSLPIVRNVGDRPLTVTDIRMAAGQGQDEYFVVDPLPIVLQPGEEFTIDPRFHPSGPGLRPGVFEIISDDPQTPIFRQAVVGTGTVAGNLDYGNDFVAVEQVLSDNAPVLRTRSDAGGNWEFFLPSETLVHIATFDPVSGLIAHGYARTNASGLRTEFNIGAFVPSSYHDSDGDGLPDDVEFAVGTSVDRIDSDGDDISDFAELSQGLNPLDGRPTITGIVAALALEGFARDIALTADVTIAGRQTAYLALGPAGLAVVDITRFDQPTLLGQLALPGNSVDVELEPVDGLAAVAGDAGGLHLIDISDPTNPQLLRTLPVSTRHVVFFDGFVYAGVASEIQVYDASTGERIETLAFNGQITGLRRDGTLLFATTVNGESTLHAIDLSGDTMVLRGSLDLLQVVSNLFVADGVAWMTTNVALVTVDVSQPDGLRNLGRNPRLQFDTAVTLNGSGLGIVVGPRLGLVVVRADDATSPGAIVTRFLLPGGGQAVALSSGLAYVAAGGAGLQVVNFMLYDQGDTPPSVSVRLLSADNDPAKSGIQMTPGATVQIAALITDDVQVRNVELLLDGTVVRNEVSYPYDLSARLPVTHELGIEAVLQVRATDTGGNVRLSDAIRIELVPDLTPPILVQLDPADGSAKTPAFRKVTLRFSEPLDPATVVAANFELIGPNGPVPADSLLLRRDDTTLFVRLPQLSLGDYQFIIHAAALTDRSGNALGVGDQITSFRIADGAPSTDPIELRGGRLSFTGNLLPTAGQIRAVADFNRDGLLDVAGPLGSYGGLTTTLLLGQGDGSFQPAPDGPPNGFSTGIHGANQVDTADFNNDGLLDLIGVTGRVQFYLGNGDGTFGAVQYALPSQYGSYTAMAIGDFNRDGNVDVVAGEGGYPTANYYDQSNNRVNGLALPTGAGVVVLLGQGDGTFTFSAAPGPNSFFTLPGISLTAADMDADGNLDLIATDGNESKLRVLRGLGDGTFERNLTTNVPLPRVTSLPAGVQLATIADLNGDGRLDAVVTGAVQVTVDTQFGRSPAVTAADVVSVLLGRGDGTFDPPVVYQAPGAFDVLAADYNGDGFPDLVVTGPPDRVPTPNTGLAALYVLLNQGDGSFSPAVQGAQPAAPLHPASGDFNRDGRLDVLLTEWSQGVCVIAGNGRGAFHTAQRFDVAPLTDSLHQLDVPLVADLNADGFADVIISERAGQIHVRLGKGDGSFQATDSIAAPIAITAIAAGDINGDGWLDLTVTSARSGTPNFGILLGHGDGTFEPLLTFQLASDVSPQDIMGADLSLADFTDDAVLDLAVGLVGPGYREIAIIRGPILKSDRTLSPIVRVPVPVFPVRLQVGDFNGDEHLDMAVLEPSILGNSPTTSHIAILGGLGNGSFSLAPDLVLASASSVSLVAADLSGDGVLDLVTAASQANVADRGSLDVLLGSGNGTFQSPTRYGEDTRWGYFRVITADVNADSHPDLVGSIADYSSPGLFSIFGSRGLGVFLNNGDGTFGNVKIYDHAGFAIAGVDAADFNRDGLTDILTVNSSDNTFSILFAGPELARPLRVATVGDGHSPDPLTMDRLPALVDAALLRWAAARIRVSAGDLERLHLAHWRIADLGSDLLGRTAGNVITLDDDAAGHGWFVDPTPRIDEEFSPASVDGVFAALGDGPAAGRMDLLTVLLHELGHVAGLDDLDAASIPDGLMTEFLAAGVRRLPR